MPIKKHPIKWRKKAFRLWRQNEHNCMGVSREMKKLGYNVSHITISRWADNEDWEAKEALAQNELRRIMRASDDPVLRELVMDDLEFARFLKQLSSVLGQIFKTKMGKRALMPRTLKEAIDIARYIREQREVLLGNARPAADAPGKVVNNFSFDNRKQNLKMQLEGLPPDQKKFVLSQVRDQLDQDSERATNAREAILAEKPRAQ